MLRAIAVSAGTPVLLPFIIYGGIQLFCRIQPPMNPKEFHSKSYEQQQERLGAHAVTLNGWQTLQVPRPRDVVLARVHSIFGDGLCSIVYRMRLLVG